MKNKIRFTRFYDFIKSANLSLNAKVILQEILSLAHGSEMCWSHNQYFSNLYKLSKSSISRSIKELINKKYIHIEYNKHNKRRIFIGPSHDDNTLDANLTRGAFIRARIKCQIYHTTNNIKKNKNSLDASKFLNQINDVKLTDTSQDSLTTRRWKHGGSRPNWKDLEEAEGTPEYGKIHEMGMGEF